MTPLAERLLRRAIVAARESRDVVLAHMLDLVLEAEGLEGMLPVAVSSGPLTPAERARRYREKRPPSVTPTVTKNVTAVTKSDGEGVGGDLGFDRLREERLEAKTATSESLILEDHPTGAEPTVTKTVTRHVTAVTRKRPSTHCPGPEESEGAVDAWCRGQKLPPASQVPELAAMLRWHQKTGTPRASWLATWQDWQKSPFRTERARSAEGGPSGNSDVREAYDSVMRADQERRIEQARRTATRPTGEPQAIGGKR